MAKKWLVLGLLSFSVGFGISLTLDRDIKRAAITGLIALPATATGVLATEQWRKRQLSHQLSSLQQNITELEKQTEILKLEEGNLQKAISTATENKKQIEAAFSSLQTEQYQLQTKVAAQQNQKQEFEQIFTTLESQKQQLETESNFVQGQLQDLRNQETELNSAVAKISDEKQNIQSLIKSHRVALDELQKQIAFQENYRSELSYNITSLEQNKEQIENEIAKIQNQLHPLKQDLAALNSAIIAVTNNHQQSQHDLSNLQTELHQLQQQLLNQQQRKDQLSQELGVMAAEKERLEVEISQLQDARKQAEENKQASIRDTKSELSTKLPPKVNEATSSYQASNKNYQKPRVRLGSNFRNSQYTKNIWEEQILPHWAHRNRPVGHRFLGSIRIKRQASEQILDIVGQNLQQFDRITYNSLQGEFYELEQNWLKILTCALSEYAYYYSNERFWQGFCERLDINHNQRVEIALRRIVDEGIDLLGLIRANGGYKYISTLWLQSGVPEQNLGHFAQLVQEIADEYGWWQIAHTPAEDLSQVLLDLCQEKHPQWGTLVNFLKASYAEDKETEPISGQLLQGIALIAQELERQNASPQVLEDDNEREELLGNYYLPQNFFLRNWNALIQVLTPKPGSSRSQNLITRRIKPLSMSLDIADTLNTQLLLPEQALWKPEWRNLRGTYCQIPQADWENTIPTNGDLIIPELVIEVNQALDKWNCQLLDHNNKELIEWQYHGINSNLPCLLFNAVTGEHLPLQNQNPVIIGLEEIIFFTPNDIQPEFADGIEVLDSYIPSSIRGWRGRLIRLTKPESSILLTIANSQSQIINWKLLTDDEPILTGFRLKGRKIIYLEPPTFWYPPIKSYLDLNVLIENLNERNIIARTIEKLSPNNRWLAILLAQWITEPGYYEARFWFDQKRWSYRFEVKSKYQVAQVTGINQLKIRSASGYLEADLPITLNTPEKFWSEIITIEGLWALEEIILFLYNDNEKIPYQLQANASGVLEIRLASLYDLLPESNWYALDYQRLGYEPQRLIEMQTIVQNISWTWTKDAINIFGLLPDKFYFLFCWNLLLPDSKSVEIQVPLLQKGSNKIEVPLNLPTGIYHIQLIWGQQLPENLGWWCGSSRYDLPQATEEDEARENYCYTILGNSESKEALIAAVRQLNLDFDIKQLQAGISSLESHQYYFPEWLNAHSLLDKLKGLLDFLSPESVPKQNNLIMPIMPTADSDKFPTPTVKTVEHGNWYLVTVRSKKREVFLKYLELSIKQNQLQDLILKIEIPQDSVYEDLVLLNISNFKTASTHLQKIENFQSIERKPLNPEQVTRMLGVR